MYASFHTLCLFFLTKRQGPEALTEEWIIENEVNSSSPVKPRPLTIRLSHFCRKYSRHRSQEKQSICLKAGFIPIVTLCSPK